MKKLITFLLVLSMALGLGACGGETVPAETTVTTAATEPDRGPSSPILYRVTDQEGHVSYLLGAVHMGTEEMYPLPSYVMDAYEASDILAVECEGPDTPQEEQQMWQCGQLSDGVQIQDLLSPETYQAAKRILEETDSYDPAFEQCKPIVWQLTIEELIVRKSEADTALGVDNHMMELARQDGTPIYEIEPVQEHYRYMGDLSMELQCLLLENTVASYRDPYVTRSKGYLCELWAQGNEPYLSTIIATDLEQVEDEQERALYQEYQDVIMAQRDDNMTRYAMEALASGETVFICVGLAHVIGEGAMVDQLTQAGYTVERVGA